MCVVIWGVFFDAFLCHFLAPAKQFLEHVFKRMVPSMRKARYAKNTVKHSVFSLFLCSGGVAFHVLGSIFATLSVDLFQVGDLSQILGLFEGRCSSLFCNIGCCFLDVFFGWCF